MDNEKPNEGRRASHLSDTQLLGVIRSRAADDKTLDALAFVHKMFATTMKNDPKLVPGLSAARGLVALYGNSMVRSDGRPHPFHGERGSTVDSIMELARGIHIPAPSLKAKRGDKVVDFIMERVADPKPYAFPNRPLIDNKARHFRSVDPTINDRPVPSDLVFEKPTRSYLETYGGKAPPAADAASKPWDQRQYRYCKPGEPSMMDKCGVVMLPYAVPFTIKAMLVEVQKHYPEVIASDVQNTVNKLRGLGLCRRVGAASERIGKHPPAALYETIAPCHVKHGQNTAAYCDSQGPGGFMGHTCYPWTDQQRKLIAARKQADAPVHVTGTVTTTLDPKTLFGGG